VDLKSLVGEWRARAGLVAPVCQLVDTVEFPLNRGSQGERIQTGSELLEGLQLSAVRVVGSEEAIQRSLRAIIDSPEPRADAHLANKLHRGLKEIHHEAELVPVEIIDGFEGCRGIIPLPAQELADVGPVFLLHVGIIVFLIRATPSELDPVSLAIAVQMIVNKLGTIVGIEALEREGDRLRHLFQRCEDDLLALPQHRTSLYPGSVDVGEIKGLEEIPVGGVAGVSDQIDLGKTGDSHLPAVGLDGDLMFEQRARLGPTVEPTLELALPRLQATIDGSRTDGKQLVFDLGGNRKAALRPGEP